MGKLFVYLPPFASDYTGVCSALFDLECFTVINDAGCCTNHYVFCDEPRWSKQTRPVFCSALRSINAILGTDDRLVDEVCTEASKMDARMVAVVGTPVPAITGMDLEGIACEVEGRLGCPALGFNTTGFASYDHGIAAAGRALIDRFAEPADPVKGRANILGMTPLDFGDNGADIQLERWVEEQGWEVGARFFMGLSIEQVRDCASAEFNVAVSTAGIEIARHLKRRFGTPYRVGFPAERIDRLAAVIEEFAASGMLDSVRVENVSGDTAAGDGPSVRGGEEAGGKVEKTEKTEEAEQTEGEGRILIVADQVVGNALREGLLRASGQPGNTAISAHADAVEAGGDTTDSAVDCRIDVASFFGWHANLAGAHDVHLKDEESYLALLRSGAYRMLIADSLLIDVPFADGLQTYVFPHAAVSGKLGWA